MLKDKNIRYINMKAVELLGLIEAKFGTELRNFIEQSCCNNKKVKQVKDPNRKKKPLTAYFHYANERRPLLRADNPEMRIPSLSKLIGEEWTKMTDEQKQPYRDMVIQISETAATS